MMAKRSPIQWALSGLLIVLLLYLGWPLFNWLFIKAQWTGVDRTACTGEGACWVFIIQHIDQFIFGFYEQSERWRPIAVTALWAASFIPLRWTAFPGRNRLIPLLILILPFTSWFVLRGGFW